MHKTTKSDLLECLELLVPPTDFIPNADVRIVDGAALVHCLVPKKSKFKVKTFQEYAQHVFLPHLAHMLQYVLRLDVVWDVYKKDKS